MHRKDNRFFQLGVTMLMVIIISVLFYVVLTHIGVVFGSIKYIIGVLSPLIFGGIFAYIMNPVMKLVEKGVKRLFSKGNITERGLKKLSRALGIIVALVLFIAIVYGLFAMVVPELKASLTETFSPDNLQSYYDKATAWLNNFAKGTPLESWLVKNDPVKAVQDWLSKEIDILGTLSAAFTGAYDVVRVILNMLIGLVISVYLLASKEHFQAQCKKFTVAIFKEKTADRIFEISRLTNRSFGGFLGGKVVDSLIIGALSYIGMLIIGLPYALISSVFIGLSNIIPFFGPLIGLVIGGVLILLHSPLQALYFLIFELALQQVDANIIGPRILGGKLGISDFWIIVSITVFAGLFGFPGMLLGVPVFTVLYTLIGQGINNALKKKEHPQNTDHYYSILTVSDLEKLQREFQDSTVFQSADTFATEYDPDEEIEYDDPDQE